MTAQITVRGDIDQRAIDQLTRCAEAGDAPLAAACADAHVGYSLCIGGVVGYRDYVSPSSVGWDEGCGNLAVRTDLFADDVPISAVMDEIVKRIDFGMGTRPGNEADHPILERIANADFVPQRTLLGLARDQLGTVGSGNHYVDLFSDEEGWLWVGVHFGSRGFGHKTTGGFLAMSDGGKFSDKGKDSDMDGPPTLLRVDSEIGQSYIAALKLASAYAFAGREVVVDRVLSILGATSTDTVHNNHNDSFLEAHMVDGHLEKLWVVRKGATPAFPGQRGFVGATMGEPSVILEGVESEAGPDLLYSTVHGAGRVMSRTQAAGKVRRFKVYECNDRDCDYRAPKDKQLPGGERIPCPDHPNGKLLKRSVQEQVRSGEIDWPAAKADLAVKGIELRGAAADEAPGAYKRLDDVLAAHSDTIRIVHRLQPLGVAMAGPDIADDFRD